MNNIYKVIWSKAKNCYVVASEIARSHTKSASGSEKIGGGTRRKLLASLMALSLLCGGLGVAEASVHVSEGTGVTQEVYTTGETYSRELAEAKLALKADATEVVKNTENIATNTANINQLNDKLNDLTTTVSGKADAANVYTKTEADTKLADYAKTTDVYNKAEVDARLRLKQLREILQLLPLLRRKEMIVMRLSTRPSTEKSPIEIRQSIMPLRRKLRIAMQRLQTQRRSFRIRSRQKKRLVRMLIMLSIIDLLPQKVRLAQMKQPLVNSKRKTLS